MDPHLPKPVPDTSPDKLHWQYSLRGLFVVTGIVALCLGTGYYFPLAVAIVVACGLAQAAIVMVVDWLIRPAHRRTLAITISAAWSMFGSALVLLGCYLFHRLGRTDGELQIGGVSFTILAAWNWAVSLSFMAMGLYCCYLAYRSWLGLSGQYTRRTKS